MFNVSGANAIIGYNNSKVQMDKFLTQIQTGNSINKAADNAAGLQIANSLRSQHLSLSQGTDNANSAISLLNIADSALDTYKETIDTMKKKAIQASTDAESPESRKALQKDISDLMQSISRIAKDTSYNGINLLNGTFSNKQFQVGAYANQTVDVTIGDVNTSKIGHLNSTEGSAVSAGTTAATLKINGSTIGQSTVSATSLGGANLVAEAINVSGAGVKANAFTSVTGAAVVGGVIADGDVKINGISIGTVSADASDLSGNLKNAINNISSKTGVTARLESGKLILESDNGNNIHVAEANSGAAKAGLTVGTNYGKVTLESQNSITIENATAVSGLNVITNTSKTLKDIDVTTYEGSQQAISIFENAIKEIDAIRGDVGAATNQLERVISVNDVTVTNVKAAESTIRGADLIKAQEEYSNWNIKNQASMFAFQMANETQKGVLGLLR